MRWLLRFVAVAVPTGLATALVLLFPAEMRELASQRTAGTFVAFLRTATWIVPALVLLASLHFNQGRLVLAALAVGHCAFVLAWPAVPAEQPALAALGTVLALAFASIGLIGPRPALGRMGLSRLLVLAAVLGGLAWLLARRRELVGEALESVGAAGRLVPWLPLPWAGAVVLVVALALLWTLPAPAGSPVRLGLGFSLLCAQAALVAESKRLPRLDVPLASPTFLLAGAITLHVTLHLVAWRRGYVDLLTGLPSRRALDEALLRLTGTYSIAIVDVDHFKRFNDRYGHAAGDDVLRLVAGELSRVRNGRAYRQGGEEFAILLPGRALDDVGEDLDALRKKIAGRQFSIRKLVKGKAPKQVNARVAVSIGFAERSEHDPTPRKVLDAADRALLRAKRTGRNRVEAERRHAKRKERRRHGRKAARDG